jgi:5-formyltetrahydrofolate cyclo-ligase
MHQSWSSKKECRSFYSALCAQEFARGLVQQQQQVNLHLRDFLKSRDGTWGAYRALPQEAQVEEVFKIPHLNWVFPRMIEGQLEFFEASDFIEGSFKVLEPSRDSVSRELHKIQGLLIPGLVFNKNGCRLGKGKGFYDKTLAQYQGIKVGICFEFQISISPLPCEPHDVIMDFLITENGNYDCKQH